MRSAPVHERLAFPDLARFAWDPVPWDGRARMEAEREALRQAEDDARAGRPPAPRVVVWTWQRPTISLGFLQDPAGFVAPDLPVVRRPTGGGAILHDREWTYGALVPLDHPRLGGSLAAATRAITGVFARALECAFGIDVDPPPGPDLASTRGTFPPACFAGALGYELTVGGRKLMGSAQRRGRRMLLQQGSLLVGSGHERLARHVRGSEPDAERTLAEGAVTLEELLGEPPDEAPFAAALEAAWAEAAFAPRD